MGDGQFKFPAGITVRSNTIFVADNFNDRIQVFNVETGPSPTSQVQANAGQTDTVNSGDTVTLNGGNSQPNDGSLQYIWRQVGGDRRVDLVDSNTATAKFEAPSVSQDSTYEFELSVMGIDNQISSDRVSINVAADQQNQQNQLNQNPQADAGDDKNVIESETVELDGGGSSDNEGEIQSYDWRTSGCDNNQPDGNIDNSDNAVATFVAPQIDSTSTVCTGTVNRD